MEAAVARDSSTLLRRVLQRAAIAARAVVRMGVSSTFPAPAAAVLYRTPSLMDCMDDDDDDYDDYDGESSFHTARSTESSAASTPVAAADYCFVVRQSRRLHQQQEAPCPSPPPAADVDSRAAEFIERFRRNASLELRYLSPSPVTTPVRPPMSPDTYFKQSSLHQHLAAVAAVSPAPAPAPYWS
ncbi:hypothetical protein GUJ93_ZPchr0010g8899 [Zizania palustris]|uniref:Uncharacterized protein n=1 Tax=Zizania palustris TaxID=103762 RepID=A0A8J5WAK1_ZIZPA|nr:hypothetical protein GUJ93_ZPchr0010g8899 [Zizania palustris]